MQKRDFRADVLLSMNIRALLAARRMDAIALASWCGHKAPWISKILSLERGVQVKDLGRIADFFGLDVCDLFQRGNTPLTERRKAQRRSGGERRAALDRRQPHGNIGKLHPDTLLDPFPPQRSLNKVK
jgi:hypothetical protein